MKKKEQNMRNSACSKCSYPPFSYDFGLLPVPSGSSFYILSRVYSYLREDWSQQELIFVPRGNLLMLILVSNTADSCVDPAT